MGFKENLITDWKDKTVEYQDKKFYIIDQFVYKDREYLLGCDIKTLNNQNLEIVFLYKIEDDIYEHVEDEDLFEKLLLHASGRAIAQKIEEIVKKYDIH